MGSFADFWDWFIGKYTDSYKQATYIEAHSVSVGKRQGERGGIEYVDKKSGQRKVSQLQCYLL